MKNIKSLFPKITWPTTLIQQVAKLLKIRFELTLEQINKLKDSHLNNDRFLSDSAAANRAVKILLDNERLSLLLKGLPPALAGNTLLALILTYIQRPVIENTMLYAWLLAMMLILIWRTFIFLQLRYRPISADKNPLVRLRVSTIATGLIWSFSPAFLFPEGNIAHQTMLSFVLAGVCAGAASSLSMDRLSALGFIAPPLLSLIFAFLLEGGKISMTMALMTALFLGFIAVSCVRGERQFQENIYLRSLAIQREAALANSEARLRNLFDLSPFGIVLIDFNSGKFIELNDRILSLSGYTKDDILQLDQWELVSEDYRNQELAIRADLIQTGRYGPYERDIIRRDGSRVPVLLNGVLIEEENGRKLVWSIVEDISDRKRIDKMKSEFVSTVSHELRTPLTAISGAISLLANHFKNEWPEPIQHMLTIAQSNSQKLNRLINDLLDIEKIASGKMSFNLEPHAILPLVGQAIEMSKPYALDYGVQLVLSGHSENATVAIDSVRFQQVLANLLSNAIKFSPKGERVIVSVQRRHNTRVRISVKDVGTGIPENFRDHIFQKFSQADSSDKRAKGGTGLGLAITKELTEKMNGTIGFESEEGKGSTFWVEFEPQGCT